MTRLKLSAICTAAVCLFQQTMFAQSDSAAAPETENWESVEDLWYVLEIAGSKIGWTNTATETNGNEIRSITQSHMKLSRGPIELEIKLDSSFRETSEGKPIAMTADQKTGLQNIVSEWKFLDDHVEYTAVQGGRTITKNVPHPEGDWLAPAAAKRYAFEEFKTGAEKIKFRTLDPQNGIAPITIITKRTDQTETIDVNGTPTPVTVWKTRSDLLPLEATDKYDSNGTLVSQTVNVGFGDMIMRITTKDEALEESTSEVPEILIKTFITPDQSIDNPMHATSLKLSLTTTSGDMSELPSTGAQRVETTDDANTVIVTVDLSNTNAYDSADGNDPIYLSSSAMVNSADERIVMMAKTIGGTSDRLELADAHRRLTYEYITDKGLDTAFASASEVVRLRKGDCSEHAVLLCALLRAENIPSRVATGLLYVDEFMGEEGIFGWHMWTQAWIDDRWVDFDATLPTRYHAGHILTATSALDEGIGAADLGQLMALIGNLEIKVLDVKHN